MQETPSGPSVHWNPRPVGSRGRTTARPHPRVDASSGRCFDATLPVALPDTTRRSFPSDVRPFSHFLQCLQAGIYPDEVVQRVLPSLPLHRFIHYVDAMTEPLHVFVPTRQHSLIASFREGHRALAGPVDSKHIGTRPYDRRRGIEAILREDPSCAQRQVQRRVPFRVANDIGAASGCPRAHSHAGLRKVPPPGFRAQAVPNVLDTTPVVAMTRTAYQNQQCQTGGAHSFSYLATDPRFSRLPQSYSAPLLRRQRNRPLVSATHSAFKLPVSRDPTSRNRVRSAARNARLRRSRPSPRSVATRTLSTSRLRPAPSPRVSTHPP